MPASRAVGILKESFLMQFYVTHLFKVSCPILGPAVSAVKTILALLGMAKPALSAPASAAATSSVSSIPVSENAYCAKGDVWKGTTSDGTAELPHGCVYTGLDGTPSPGKVTVVAAGGNFVNAVRAASCGDTIKLQQGATFTLGGSP